MACLDKSHCDSIPTLPTLVTFAVWQHQSAGRRNVLSPEGKLWKTVKFPNDVMSSLTVYRG
jgi:hypothetical protein